MNRILVIRLGAMGDVLRTMPAVSALRAGHPNAHISWLVEPRCAGVLKLCPAVDEVLLFARQELSELLRSGRLARLYQLTRGLQKRLQQPGFDLVLDFHGLLKSGVLSWLTRSPLRMGYAPPHAREFSWLFSHRRIDLPRPYCSRFQRNQALVAELGVVPDVGRRTIRVPESAARRMRAELGEASGSLVLHAGSSSVASHKRWPSERFSALARRAAQFTGRPCLVLAGPGADEAALQREVVMAAQGAAQPAPATPSQIDLAALLAEAGTLVAADSGPLHLAGLLGTPVVQLLGPTDPVENEPYSGSPWRRAHVPLSCSPCRRGCAAAHCMASLSVDLVWTQLQGLWRDVKPLDSAEWPSRGGS